MKSPLTGVDMPSTTLIPNHSFKKAIETAIEAAAAADEATRDAGSGGPATAGRRKRQLAEFQNNTLSHENA